MNEQKLPTTVTDFWNLRTSFFTGFDFVFPTGFKFVVRLCVYYDESAVLAYFNSIHAAFVLDIVSQTPLTEDLYN